MDYKLNKTTLTTIIIIIIILKIMMMLLMITVDLNNYTQLLTVTDEVDWKL